MKKTIIGVFWLFIWFHIPGIANVQSEGKPQSNTLILLQNQDNRAFLKTCKELREMGFLPLHKIPPSLIIGYDPANIADSLKHAHSQIALITREPVSDLSMKGVDKETQMVLKGWNNLLLLYQGLIPEEIQGEKVANADHGSDCIMEDLSSGRSLDQLTNPMQTLMMSPASLPFGAGTIDTSVFYIGDVMVTVICPESNGVIDPNTEDWTAAEESAITGRVLAAYDAIMMEEGGSHISYTYDFLYSQACDYEAATRWESSSSTTWVSQIMDDLGYGASGTARSKVRAFCNDQRDLYDTHWSHVIFMVDVSTTGKKRPYSYHGGPYHLNDNLDDFTAIMHETGHIFFAIDEYSSSFCSCTESSGYLNFENQNCKSGGCLYDVDCTMDTNTPPYCKYTRGHIGWADTDKDGLPDVVDTFPETALNQFLPDPTSSNILTYTGSAVVSPLKNLNPFGSSNDISINTIQTVEYRIDYGPWFPAIPVDTAFNSPLEEFEFTTPALMNGTHLVEVRAVNNYGNTEITYAYDYVTVLSPPSTAVPTPTGTWYTPTIIPSPTPTMHYTYLLDTRTPTPVMSPTITPTVTGCLHSESLDTNPGWSTEGGWEYGQPLGMGGLEAGYPDPDRGYTGLNVYGYNLAGDYPNNIPSRYYLTAGMFDCSSLTNVTLSFFSYLNVEGILFDQASVEVSTDGMHWIVIWHNDIEQITDNSWREYIFDISMVADGQSRLSVRWGIGPTDESLQFSGWNIDDVKICGDESVIPTSTPVYTPVRTVSGNLLHYATFLLVLTGVIVIGCMNRLTGMKCGSA